MQKTETVAEVIARQETYGPFIVAGTVVSNGEQRAGYLNALDIIEGGLLGGIGDPVIAKSVMHDALKMMRLFAGVPPKAAEAIAKAHERVPAGTG